MGRKSTFTQAIADEICERLSEGEPLRAICRDEHMPNWRTFYLWLVDYPDFAAQIARAREIGFHAIAHEAWEIADTPCIGDRIEETDDGRRKVVREDMLGHRKLQIETRLKLLAKWSPKLYGEMVKQEISGPDGEAVKIEQTSRPVLSKEEWLAAHGMSKPAE